MLTNPFAVRTSFHSLIGAVGLRRYASRFTVYPATGVSPLLFTVHPATGVSPLRFTLHASRFTVYPATGVSPLLFTLHASLFTVNSLRFTHLQSAGIAYNPHG